MFFSLCTDAHASRFPFPPADKQTSGQAAGPSQVDRIYLFVTHTPCGPSQSVVGLFSGSFISSSFTCGCSWADERVCATCLTCFRLEIDGGQSVWLAFVQICVPNWKHWTSSAMCNVVLEVKTVQQPHTHFPASTISLKLKFNLVQSSGWFLPHLETSHANEWVFHASLGDASFIWLHFRSRWQRHLVSGQWLFRARFDLI